jgi:hypothetical protein
MQTLNPRGRPVDPHKEEVKPALIRLVIFHDIHLSVGIRIFVTNFIIAARTVAASLAGVEESADSTG